MRRILFGFLLFTSVQLLFPFTSISQEAQETKAHNFWHRVSVGGNFGFQFGSVTGIVLSPEVKIRIVDQLYLGVGFNYEYLRFKDYYYRPSTDEYLDFKSNVYGGRLFARYYLSSIFDNALGNIFGHIEYEYLTYSRPYKSCQPADGSIIDPQENWYRPGKQSMDFNSIFVGGGYSQTLGGRAFLDLMILFNLNDSYLSPYTNPLFRLGFGIGL
jgi:hypothetical protein